MDYLTDQEKERVEVFYKDEIAREAVRKILLAGLYKNGTLTAGKPANPAQNAALSMVANANAEVTNEQLGGDLRALYWGIVTLESAFKELAKCQKLVEAPKEENVNPGL